MNDCNYYLDDPFSQLCDEWDLNAPDQMFVRSNYVITQSAFKNMTQNELMIYGRQAMNNMQEKLSYGQYSKEQKGDISKVLNKFRSFFKKDGEFKSEKMEKYLLTEFQQAEFALMPQDYQVVPYFNQENLVLNTQIDNERAFDVVAFVPLGTELNPAEKSALLAQSQEATGEAKSGKAALYVGAAALAYLLFK